MANKNDYDDLLSMFETRVDPKEDKPAVASSENTEAVRGEGNVKKTSAPSSEKDVSSVSDMPTGKAIEAKTHTQPSDSFASQQGKSPMARRFNREMEDVSSDSSRDSNGIKSGVYFSNPPKDIKEQAQLEQGIALNSTTKETAKRRAEAIKENAQIPVKKKKKGLRNFAIELAIIAVVSLILCWYGLRCINDVLALEPEGEAVEVTVEAGMTDNEVIDILHEKGLVKNKLFCKLFIQFFNKDGDYISGIYTLSPSLGVEKMISTMKTDFRSSETVTLTFPEGWTVNQMAEKLESNGVCTASSFISTLQTVDFSDEYDFISSINNVDKRYIKLEGYLYPDTYEFYVGENASSVVRRFLDNFESKWTEEYQEQLEARGLTIDEVVTMASIIQEEAANQEQMGKISSVLYNRVGRPEAFPLLQCDSTEDYLVNTIKPSLTSSVEDTHKYLQYRDNYDTYSDVCVGLPVGAITNPGEDAIYAALFPEDTDYYYFRHDVEGGVYYAETFAQHEQNGRIAAQVG